MDNLVVARYRDGRIVKGRTINFCPSRRTCHVVEIDDPYGDGEAVALDDLKALFFVRSVSGNRLYDEAYELSKVPGYGRPAVVVFSDGEQITGLVTGIEPRGIGFFLAPADPLCNNSRAYVVWSSVAQLRMLDDGTEVQLANSSSEATDATVQAGAQDSTVESVPGPTAEQGGSARCVVALFPDGREVRGETLDFSPDRSELTVTVCDGTEVGQERLSIRELKALHFVDDPDRLPTYTSSDPALRSRTDFVRVVFADGEELIGLAAAMQPSRAGFFVYPPDGGEERVFVVWAAVSAIEPADRGGASTNDA